MTEETIQNKGSDFDWKMRAFNQLNSKFEDCIAMEYGINEKSASSLNKMPIFLYATPFC